MLAVKGLHAWYGESHVLHGVDFVVNQGEVVTLLGRNGVGKTTTLKSIMGMVGRREGAIAFEGRETIALSSDRIARRIAFRPPSADFREPNVLRPPLPPQVRAGGMTLEQITSSFRT